MCYYIVIVRQPHDKIEHFCVNTFFFYVGYVSQIYELRKINVSLYMQESNLGLLSEMLDPYHWTKWVLMLEIYLYMSVLIKIKLL